MKIAIIDDQQEIRYSLSKILQRHNHKTVQYNGLEFDIAALIEEQAIELLIVDVMLSEELTGIDLIKSFKKKGLDISIILMTAYTTPENMIEASKIGIKDILQKPFGENELIELVDKLSISKKKELPTPISHVNKKSEFVGSFETMKEIYHKIGIAANNDLAVLIYGETGTGKELIANLIHKNSERNDEPYIAINCASIPKELFESQLFGHEKGSFTSADKQHIGYAEQTRGGTLFLDEIGELDAELQSKLLRFLETRRFRRVGGSKELIFEGRIISATNVNLKEKSEKGLFREDLYFRLSILSINMPTLAERSKDIPILCEHFIDKANKELKTSIKSISKEAITSLMQQPWKGNIRELRNAIYSACLNARDKSLEVTDFVFSQEEDLDSFENQLKSLLSEHIQQSKNLKDLEITLQKVFLSTCFAYMPNISQLSQALNRARNTLKKQLKELEIYLP
jgi:DNA-binding NtrC family response regulator